MHATVGIQCKHTFAHRSLAAKEVAMSFLVPLCFAVMTAAGSNIGMLIQSVDQDNAKVICLLAMFVCVICCTTIVCLAYWLLPQLIPRKTDEATDDLIDQFIEFKNAIYERLDEETLTEPQEELSEDVKKAFKEEVKEDLKEEKVKEL